MTYNWLLRGSHDRRIDPLRYFVISASQTRKLARLALAKTKQQKRKSVSSYKKPVNPYFIDFQGKNPYNTDLIRINGRYENGVKVRLTRIIKFC